MGRLYIKNGQILNRKGEKVDLKWGDPEQIRIVRQRSEELADWLENGIPVEEYYTDDFESDEVDGTENCVFECFCEEEVHCDSQDRFVYCEHCNREFELGRDEDGYNLVARIKE